MSTPEPRPLVEARAVAKSFSGVQALRHADFDLRPGEIHAIVGENGAGKSTFIKIVTGALTPDSGTLRIDGHDVAHNTPNLARSLGVRVIYQQPSLFPQLTVAENIPVLQNEDPGVWQRVLDTHHARYNPADDIEKELVQDIAFCLWRMRRVRGVEAAIWDIAMEDQAEQLEEKYSSPTERTRKAFAFKSEPQLQLVSRYEGRLRRAYERAIVNLAQYRSGRACSSAHESSADENDK